MSVDTCKSNTVHNDANIA